MPRQDGDIASIQALLEQGYRLHQQGRLDEAEQQYRQFLAIHPTSAQALHLLGVLALQKQDVPGGVGLLKRALAGDPNYAPAHHNLGQGLEQMGQDAEAAASYGRMLALEPDHAGAYADRARVLARLGRKDQALADYDQALARAPSALLAYLRAELLLDLDRPDDAMAGFGQSLALDPNFAAAHFLRGTALAGLGRHAEALADYDRAIALKPLAAASHLNRGLSLLELARHADALESFERALALKPGYVQALISRGTALAHLARPGEALESYNRALGLTPDDSTIHCNRGNVLVALGQLDDAMAAYEHAIAMGSGQARPDTMTTGIDRGAADAQFNLGSTLLLTGDFARGLPLYEWRKRNKTDPAWQREFAQPLWQGQEDIAGKTLFVYWEQGFGDTLQFFRYLTLAQARGAHVIFSAHDRLHRLLKLAAPQLEIIPGHMAPTRMDFHIPLMSLPLAFRTRLESIPAGPPYLMAEPERVAAWGPRIGSHGLRVGIAWQGNKAGAADAGRSFAVRQFAALADIPGLRLISLQKGDGVEQLDDLPPGLTIETLGADFDAGPDAFVDTAAAMQSLDLIITSDTAIAHLAGALGRPVWIALKYVPEWRWQLHRADSPWYPTARLFRQPALGDWDGAFGEIRAQLTAAIAAGRFTQS